MQALVVPLMAVVFDERFDLQGEVSAMAVIVLAVPIVIQWP